MPPMQENQIKTEGIEKLGAGVQYSVVLTKAKNLVVWGSTMASRLNLIPSEVQGKVEDFDTSPINMIVAKTDGTVQLLGVLGAENQTTMPKKLTDGTVFVKKLPLQVLLQQPLMIKENFMFGDQAGIKFLELMFQNLKHQL